MLSPTRSTLASANFSMIFARLNTALPAAAASMPESAGPSPTDRRGEPPEEAPRFLGEVPPAARGGGRSHPPAPSTRRHHPPPQKAGTMSPGLLRRAGEDVHLRAEVVGRGHLRQRSDRGAERPFERALVARAEGRVLDRALGGAVGDLGDHHVEVAALARHDALEILGIG